jgi:hypothetical protein
MPRVLDVENGVAATTKVRTLAEGAVDIVYGVA